MRTFALYPEERHWWSFNDYGAVIDVMAQLKPKKVLEFGPGSSTLALLEGGATAIDACEDDPHWFAHYTHAFAANSAVLIHRFTWADPLVIPSLSNREYDMALIDGPESTEKRPVVVEYCLQRCRSVLVPTEDHLHEGILRPHLHRLADIYARNLTIIDTGPLAGSFALLTEPNG